MEHIEPARPTPARPTPGRWIGNLPAADHEDGPSGDRADAALGAEVASGTTTGAGAPGEHETGDQAVDAALSTLDRLPDLPVREHVAVFDAVHSALADRLAEPGG